MNTNLPANSQRALLLWNRVWLTMLVLAGLAWGVKMAFEQARNSAATVHASWSGDTLQFSSIQGFVVITHLVGVSEHTPVAATLPAPLFISDSAGARVDQTLWKKLRWRGDGGGERPAPPVGSKITGLYQRQEATQWRQAEDKP